MDKMRFMLVLCGLMAISLSSGCVESSKGTPTNENLPTTPTATTKLKVVTSTTQLSTLTETIGGSYVTVTNIITPKENPFNYRLSEKDIENLSSADLFLLFDWQIDRLASPLNALSKSNQPRIEPITTVKSWLLPEGQIELAGKIAEALTQADKNRESEYYSAAKEYVKEVNDKEYSVMSSLVTKLPGSPLPTLNVICAEPEREFIEWLGLTVVATYNGFEPFKPDELRVLVEKGKSEKVTTIVDDLQSGLDLGIELAREIEAHRVILSRYPGGYDYAWSWADTVDANISRVLRFSTHC